MFMEDIEGLSVKTKIEVQCDKCFKVLTRSIAAAKERRKKRSEDKDYCGSCASKLCVDKKPQCGKDFWDDEKRQKHSDNIKSSAIYYEGIKNRPSVVGEANPMYGKTFSPESKAKRAKIWKGRSGEKATNWKGGKSSLNRRVKSALQRKYKWFHRVMDRDGCKCQHCGAEKKLDAHHITPISTIIKELMNNTELLTESDKINWLMVQPEIVDDKLENGITLCRKCHREVHKNWGSHEPQVRQSGG